MFNREKTFNNKAFGHMNKSVKDSYKKDDKEPEKSADTFKLKVFNYDDSQKCWLVEQNFVKVLKTIFSSR